MHITPIQLADSLGISKAQLSTLRTVLKPNIPTKVKRGSGGRPPVMLSTPEAVSWLCQIWPEPLSAEIRRDIFARSEIL